MSEELKPCPFCGAKASVQRYSSGTGGPKCAIWCDACHVGTSWLHGDDGEARVVAEWNRRAPVAARELDVEAERREFEAFLGRPMMNPEQPSHYNGRDVRAAWESWQASAARFRAESGNTKPEQSGISRELAEAAPVSTEQAVDAHKCTTTGVDGQKNVEVSTEQAGDAWIDLKQRKPRDWEKVLVSLDNGTVTVGMRGSMGWHWEESDAPEDAEATATHWKPWPVAPSPNNSPVGADKEP